MENMLSETEVNEKLPLKSELNPLLLISILEKGSVSWLVLSDTLPEII